MSIVHRLGALLIAGLLAGMAPPVLADIYHVDAVRGDDRNDGLSRASSWQSLKRVADFPFKPGDRILLAAGSVWREPLRLHASGTATAPISIAREGDGARPRIDAGGIAENAVELINVEYVAISGIEVTNNAPERATRRGVLVAADDFGVAHDIRITDLYIHDIKGANLKDNGGIVFRATGTKVPSRFEGITIARNILWKVDRSGIAGISDQVSRARWFPSRFVVIRDNYLEEIGGDGIVPRGTDGALVEHNIVRHAAMNAGSYTVAIWQWSTDNSLIQLNEAAFTHGILDGQGFDSDFNSRNTTLLYNYSHDNEGGFMLLCTPVKRDDAVNLGNSGTVVRSNVSRGDRTRIFQLTGASDAVVERNVIHVAPDVDVQMVVATPWDGWSNDILFRDNLFNVAGTARYGYAQRAVKGQYILAEGDSPARNIGFRDNLYYGRHIDPPEDPDSRHRRRRALLLNEADWAVPLFDPARPDDFAAYIDRHRTWMLHMLAHELGERPLLAVPQIMPPDKARSLGVVD